jgi:hypothetical protein
MVNYDLPWNPNRIEQRFGSEWANYATPSLLLREGRLAEAREAVKRMPAAPHYYRDLLKACLQGPPSELDRMAHEAETSGPSDPDPEHSYYQGTLFAYAAPNSTLPALSSHSFSPKTRSLIQGTPLPRDRKRDSMSCPPLPRHYAVKREKDCKTSSSFLSSLSMGSYPLRQ